VRIIGQCVSFAVMGFVYNDKARAIAFVTVGVSEFINCGPVLAFSLSIAFDAFGFNFVSHCFSLFLSMGRGHHGHARLITLLRIHVA
jgi:hypothetical protein